MSSFSFVCSMDHPEGFLVSGGGDATVSQLGNLIIVIIIDVCHEAF